MTVEQARDDIDDAGFEPVEEALPAEPVLARAEPAGLSPDETEADQPAPDGDERAAILASVPEVEVAEEVAPVVPEELPAESSEPAAPGEPPAEPPAIEPVVAGEADAIAFPAAGTEVSIWPFVALDAVWLAFAGFIVWQLTQLPQGVAVYESGIYPLTLLGGLVLTAAGPVLIVVSWFAEKARLAATSGHVFISALMRGSLATLVGVALWWIALLAVDQIRLGRLF